MTPDRAEAGSPSRSTRLVSIVMPVLNEEARILRAVEQAASTEGVSEVVVVDGGSTDRTRELAASVAGVRVISAPRGRGSQMNAGAREAGGDVLLFLHADVTLPKDAMAQVREALSDPTVAAGAFRTWTVAEEPRPWWSALLHLADVRSRYTTLPYGDQALFVRASVFEALGGFASLELMEDIDFARRLAQLGRTRTVPACVTVSGRRFVARPVFYAAVMNLFPLLFRLGVPARTLSALYGHVR